MKLQRAHSWLLLAGLVLGTATPAGNAERTERWDRSVDVVALSAQNKAIAKYQFLIKRYRGTSQERALRMQMLEAMEDATNLEFRIAHGDASLKKRAVDYTRYHKSLKNVIATATILIQEAPRSEENVRIYFVRAQAFAELKDQAKASKDYDFITVHFPQTPFAVRSNLALAGFATDAGLHRVAIQRLKKVEEFPEDTHYPIALYQLAWAYFNLEDIPTSTSYLKRHIAHFREKAELAASENSALEHSLKDYVLFYFEGFMKNLSDNRLDDALEKFRKLEKGPYLGKMILEFANLLRSREKAEELDRWQAQIIDEESDRPQAIDVVITHVDYLLSHKAYDRIVVAASGFKKLDDATKGKMRESEGYPKAQNLILAAANALQKLIAQTKDQDKSVKLSRTLAGVYDSFTAIVAETDPRLQQIHYNLGETLFSIKEFDNATAEYRWVLQHWSKSAGLKRAEISLKAISSRYQSLDRQQLLPKELKPIALTEDDDLELDRLKKPVAEWIGWIDEYIDDFGRTPKAFDHFEFEANRVLYVNGQTRAALKRILAQIKARPDSKIATGAASLVLDTYVFDKQWQLLLDVSESFLETPKLGDAAFRTRLAPMPADASFKLLEAAYQEKDYDQVLDRVKRFEKRYPKSALLPDCLYLASRAADQLQKPDRALHYLSELLTRFPKTDKRSIALLARASLSEAAYDFDAAAADYQTYLATAPKSGKSGDERTKLIKRLFVVTWLSKRVTELDCRKYADTDDLETECDRYQAMIALTRSETKLRNAELVKKATSGSKENRPLWAAVALTFGGTSTGFRDRLTLSRTLAGGFADQDPLFQFVLVPVLNQRIPETFAAARASIPKSVALKPSERVLARRIDHIKQLETTATKLVKLPWSRIKIAVLSDVAQAYEDFCAELVKLKPPEGLTPEELAEYKKGLDEMLGLFREKGKTIRTQVAELAAEFPVAPTDIGATASRSPASRPEPIDFALIRKTVGTPDGDLYKQWEDALKGHSWARAAFFFGQIKEKGELSDATLSLMRAVSLSMSGARPEAVAELESALSRLDSGTSRVKRVLYSQYATSTATKNAAKYGEEVAQ